MRELAFPFLSVHYSCCLQATLHDLSLAELRDALPVEAEYIDGVIPTYAFENDQPSRREHIRQVVIEARFADVDFGRELAASPKSPKIHSRT